jgi:hypothetical protein
MGLFDKLFGAKQAAPPSDTRADGRKSTGRVVNNKLTSDIAHYVMPPLPPELQASEGIIPWEIVVDPQVGTETVLLLLDRTSFIYGLAKVRPFDLCLKSGFVDTSQGPVFFLLFHVPDPNRPGVEYSAIDVHVNPYDPKHMIYWRNLARQSHWHVILVGPGDKLVDLFEFQNAFGLSDAIEAVELTCQIAPQIAGNSFDEAKAEFSAKYSIDDLLKM